MKNKKTLIISGTALVVLTILYLAYRKKKNEQENDFLSDVEFQQLITKIDNAKK
jgi:LPXTG-motif cell wall-anchored protein